MYGHIKAQLSIRLIYYPLRDFAGSVRSVLFGWIQDEDGGEIDPVPHRGQAWVGGREKRREVITPSHVAMRLAIQMLLRKSTTKPSLAESHSASYLAVFWFFNPSLSINDFALNNIVLPVVWIWRAPISF